MKPMKLKRNNERAGSTILLVMGIMAVLGVMVGVAWEIQ